MGSLLKKCGAKVLLPSSGPTGGDSNDNDISLSSKISSILGAVYEFFVSMLSITILLFTIY